ncbi:MAG: ferredoxin [Desulfoarculaceae bacterium]|nr:ferredoxin [Desulfoarculaceae bacterium]
MKNSIALDSYECNGCGSCAEVCPDVFAMDETGDKGVVINPNAEITPLVEEAAAYCPAKCISLTKGTDLTITQAMSHQQLTKIFESGKTSDPFDETLSLAALIQPSFNPVRLRQLHHDVARMFGGTYPGFRSSTTQYHNLKHTCSVVLATARLLHGLSCSGQDISIHTLELALYSAYLHDTGLLTETSDKVTSGAIYSQMHEERSITLMKQYLAGNKLSDLLIQECSSVIHCTDLALAPQEIPFPSPEAKLAGYVLGSADILAQMADRYYLERLPFLYQELKEGGLETRDSAIDFIQDTTIFYHNIITERLEKSFSNTAQAMQTHFDKRWQINENLYYINIDKNITYLKKILRLCEDELEDLSAFLKRTPPP